MSLNDLPVAQTQFYKPNYENAKSFACNGLPLSLRVPGQNFVLLSYLAEEGTRQKASMSSLMIHGVFATEDESKKFAHRMMDAGFNFFDLHTIPLHMLIPVPIPDSDLTAEFHQDFIKKQMQGYVDKRAAEEELLRLRQEQGNQTFAQEAKATFVEEKEDTTMLTPEDFDDSYIVRPDTQERVRLKDVKDRIRVKIDGPIQMAPPQ